MNPEQVRMRVAEMLLEELKKDQPDRWFYISVANDKFIGGYYLKAKGPTDAWCKLHALKWFVLDIDADTQTYEVPEEHMKSVPESMRWRKLSAEEVKSIK